MNFAANFIDKYFFERFQSVYGDGDEENIDFREVY